MKFKPGDRLRAKVRPEILATVRDVDSDSLYIVLDEPLVSEDNKGNRMTHKEGFVSHAEAESIFELDEESDWASIWDKGST
jgi:hypothetical protein